MGITILDYYNIKPISFKHNLSLNFYKLILE